MAGRECLRKGRTMSTDRLASHAGETVSEADSGVLAAWAGKVGVTGLRGHCRKMVQDHEQIKPFKSSARAWPWVVTFVCLGTVVLLAH